MDRLLLVALLAVALLPACGNESDDPAGGDEAPMMDDGPPPVGACRVFLSCTWEQCDTDLWEVEARCEGAQADPDDAWEPGPECTTIDADIGACLTTCAGEVPEATATERSDADAVNYCYAHAVTEDEYTSCDQLLDECDRS